MNRILKSIKKHIMIYFLFMKNSLMGYFEYRANLFAGLSMELVYLASKILYVLVFYSSEVKINGVSPDEIMIFVGTFIIMTAIYTAFFMDNFYQLPEHVRNGTLDVYITKPLSLQFMATLRHINFVIPVPNLIAGITMVALAWKRLGIVPGFFNIAGYLLFLVSSTLITYAIFLIPQIIAFWTIKSNGITEITDRCWDFNNMPMLIYSKWMQRIGVFVIPVFLITNFPSLFVLGKLSRTYMIWTFLAPICFLTLVRLLWQYAVKNYTSASS